MYGNAALQRQDIIILHDNYLNLEPAVKRQPLFPRERLEELVKSIRNVMIPNVGNDNGLTTHFTLPNKHPNKPNRMTSKHD